MRRRISVLSAPSNLGLKPPAPGREPGVRDAPAALLKRGLLEKLGARHAGVVVPALYDPEVDPASGIRNTAEIRNYTIKLANRVGELLDERQFPLVLGGDCSILLGSALALRRRGRFGLLFIDGHTDLLTPAISATQGAAGMDLALVTGIGPDMLTSIEELKPYFQQEDVVVCGFRWPEVGKISHAHPQAPMVSLPLRTLRERGVAKATEQALAHFAELEFWVHVDADVLDPRWMPAVDSPDPDGLSPEDLSIILKAALAVENCVGLELTIYDPSRDPTEKGASLLVDMLSDVMVPFGA